MSENKDKRGFSSLSSLTSKVEKKNTKPPKTWPTSSRSNPSKKTETSQRTAPHSHDQKNPQRTTSSNSSGSNSFGSWAKPSVLKWLLGVVGVIVVITFLNSNPNGERSSPSSSYTPSAQTSTTNYNPPSQTTQSTRKLKIVFERPPVGRSQVLSVSQIRWCLRESYRLDARRPLIANNSDVASFNQIVRNYNQRCTKFKYRRGALQRAKREFEAMRQNQPALLD